MLNITDLYIEGVCTSYRPPFFCINRLFVEDVCLTYRPPIVNISRIFIEDVAFVFLFLLVVDKAGDPIAGATVSVVSGSYSGSETTDSNGVSQGLKYSLGVTTIITVSKVGYQDSIVRFTETIMAIKIIPITMSKSVSLVLTRQGYAVNMQPANSENNMFN